MLTLTSIPVPPQMPHLYLGLTLDTDHGWPSLSVWAVPSQKTRGPGGHLVLYGLSVHSQADTEDTAGQGSRRRGPRRVLQQVCEAPGIVCKLLGTGL